MKKPEFLKLWEQFKSEVERFNNDPYRPKAATAEVSFEDFVYWLETGSINY